MARVRFIMFIGVVLCMAGFALSGALAQDKTASSSIAQQRQVIVTITDRQGRYMGGGLNKPQVTLLDNDVPQDVLTLEESGFPVSIGLLFNVSEGRYRDSLALMRKAILSYFELPQKTNQYFIVGFEKDSLLVSDWSQEPKELSGGFDKLAGMKPSKSATTFDALENGMKKMAGAKYFKRALIMISDTDHSGSNSQRDQLLETVRRSHVLVYSISIDTRQSSHHPALDRICSVSGGFAKSAQNSAEILDLMEIVSLELKHQYLITFVPTNVSSTVDEWHRFRFAVKPLLVQKSSSKKYEELPLFIRSREGYYPSQ